MGRLRARNVMDVGYEASEIEQAVIKQMRKSRFKSAKIYGDGSAARDMVRILKDIKPEVQKFLAY